MRPKFKYNNMQTDMLLGMKNIEQRRQQAYDDYIKKREEELLSGKPIPFERFKEIAPIFNEELNIINERYGNVTTFRGMYDAKRESRWANETQEMIGTYEKLIKNTNFFDQIVSPKKQSGLNLIDKTIELDTNFTKIRGVSSINKLFQHATTINNIINGADGYFAAFDMETLSGKNKYGYDDLLGVTEYAFNIHGQGGQYLDSISNVVGVDSARYDKLMERLESLRNQSNKDWTELDRITIGRLNFYNNATIKDVAGEARREITKSTSLDGMESTVEGAISGLKKLGKISDDQMKVVQQDFQQIAAGMAQNGSVNIKGKSYNIKATTGHNTRAFDIPKFNRAAKLYGASAYVDETNLANFDLLQAIKYIYAKNGGNYYGTGEDAPIGKGLMTLEYLKAMYPGIETSDLVAHTAFEDTKTSARMLMAKVDSNKNTTLLQDILSQLGEMRPKSQSTFVGGNKQLYRVDQATSFSNFNRTGAIGFVHDKFSNSFKTFNGYEINGSNVTKSHMGQSGLKSGALYSFDLKTFETGDDFRKAFGNGLDNVISEFNTDRLYVLAGTPVFDTNTPHAIGARQDIYYVTNSLDPIEGMLNNMQEIGERSAYGPDVDLNDIKSYKAKAGISKDKSLSLSTVQNGVKQTLSQQTDAGLLNEFGQLSTERLTNEYAANYIREMDYDKYKKFKNVIQDITNTYKNELTPNASISQKISFAISKGQTLGGFNDIGGVFDALKFPSFITGKEELMTNSINRMTWAANNLEGLAPIFDQISSMIDEQIVGDDYATKLKKNEAFKAAVRDVLDTTSKNNLLKTASGIKKAQATAFDSTPTKLLNSDLDYIELTGRQLFGNVGDDNLFRINIGENRLDDNILKKLFDNQFGGRLGANIDGAHGKQALLDFINRLNKDETYRGVFNTIDKEATPKELSAEVMTRLNNFVYRRREKDNLFGIINKDINTQVANIPSKVASHVITPGMKDVVNNAIKSVQNYVIIDRSGKINQSAIDSLVKRMVQVSASDIEKLDLDPSSKKTLLSNFNLAKADVENVAKDILTAISETDLQLSFNEKENNFGEFIISNKGQNAKRITMPVLRMKNGVLNFDLDTTSHVVRPAINERMLAKGQIEFTSKLGEIAANNGGFTAFVKAAKNKGTDELGAFASAFNSLNQNIREGMPAVQIFNPQAFGMQLEAYTEDITGYLDKFSSNGKATGLPGYAGLSDSERKQVENIFKKIEKKSNNRKDLRWSKLTSSERSIFLNKIAMPLFKDNYPDEIHSQTDSGWILKNLMVGGKSTHLTDSGTLSIGRVSPDFMTSFDAQGRDNPTQWGNMYYHRADVVKKALNEEHLKGKVSTQPLISDLRKDFTIFNPTNELGIKMTGMVSGKFASMDTGTLRRIVVKAGDVVGDKNPFISQAKIILGITDKYDQLSPELKSKIDNIAAGLKEKALHASTYMQETVLYSRLAGSVFNKSQRQIINDNKTLQAQFASDIEKIEKLRYNLEDGKFKYGSGFEVNADDILLAQEGYANSRKAYGAKSTGIMKGAFFDKYGNIITEEEINKAIRTDSTYDNIEGYLKSKYDFDYKYYIDAYELKDGVKITLSKTEKSVAYGLQSRLGEFNDDIVQKLTGTKFEKYLGTYATETLLDQMEASGLKGIKNLALTETHAVGDILFDKILGSTGAVAITAQDVPKHANVSVSMTAAIGKLKEQGLLTTENIGKIMPGATVKDGTVYVSGSDKFADNYINGKELTALLGDNVFTTSKIYDEDVNTGYGEFTQTIDWQGGTSQGIDAHERDVKTRDSLIDEISSLERQRKQALRNNEDFLSFDIDIAEKSKQLQELKDKMSTEGYIHRGFVYSDRMHDILGARVLNDEYIGNLQDKNDDIINKAIGDFTENGMLREEFRSQQLLSPLTDLYKNNIFEKPGAQKLSEVTDDDIKYGDVKKFFTDSNGKITLGDNVSAAWAEKAYTAGSTAEALRFNERVQAGKSVKVEGFGSRYNFQSKNFEDFSPSIGGMLESQLLDKDNSPNFQNTLFDLGESFGSKRYLAVSRPSFANTGDSLTVPDHFAKLSALKSQHETWRRDRTDENKQKVIDTLDSLVDQQKIDFDLLKRDMTKTRLDRSFTAKGGGMVIYRGSHSELSESAYRNLSSADRLAELKKYNEIKALTDAKFEGKSYLEHYSEGRYLDAVLLSEKAFENMGYFSEDSLKRYGVKTREEMVDMLSSKGDVHLIGRFPMIREGSAVSAWAILDKSLVGNEARFLGGSQMAMNLDYDGDTTHVHALQNKNGESYLNYVNSGNKYDEFHSRIRMNILSRSVSENRFYESQVQEQLAAETKIAINTGNFMEVAKKAITDGDRIFANITTPNQEEVLNAYNQVKALGLGDNEALSHMENLEGDGGKIKYAMYKAQEALMVETAAKTQKSVIGESNVINFKGRKLFTTFVDRNIEDYNIKRDMFSDTVDAFEQKVISAKKATDITNLEKAEQWKTAINNIIGNRNVRESRQTIKDLFDENISKDVGDKYMKYVESHASFREAAMTKAEFTERVKGSFLETLDMFKGNKQVQDIMATTINFGESKYGSGSFIFDHMLSLDSDTSIQGEAVRRLNAAKVLESGRSQATEVLESAPTKKILSDGREWLKGESTGQRMKNVLKSTGEIFEKISKGFDGKMLAMGSLGLAGAYLVAGFVGGNPSKPAETQAMEDSQSYNIPSLLDQDLQYAQRNKQPGYVINVNAKTSKDKQYVSQAINNAISRNYNTNVNIAMNITDDKGNINDRYIEQLLAGAIQ